MTPNRGRYATKNTVKSNQYLLKKNKIRCTILRVHCPLKEGKYTANKKCRQEPLDGTVFPGYQHQDERVALHQQPPSSYWLESDLLIIDIFIR